MELKGSKTEQNLMEAFAGESQARNKYTYFASKAKKEGYVQISNVFTETAGNEKEHAEMWFKALNGGGISDTLSNLVAAAAGEHGEWTDMYKRMSEEAKAEGFEELAYQFGAVAKIEAEHEARYLALAKNVQNGQVFTKDVEVEWQCTNCGYTHTSKSALMMCPVCAHPQAYFEVKKNNY